MARQREDVCSHPGQELVVAKNKAVEHLFNAKLLLRRLEKVDLTSEQVEAFNKLSAQLTARIVQRREEVGITKEVIQRRDKVYSRFKKTDLKEDDLWNKLQAEAKLTDAQRDVFRESLVIKREFRDNVLKLLTEDQKKRLPKGKVREK